MQTWKVGQGGDGFGRARTKSHASQRPRHLVARCYPGGYVTFVLRQVESKSWAALHADLHLPRYVRLGMVGSSF